MRSMMTTVVTAAIALSSLIALNLPALAGEAKSQCILNCGGLSQQMMTRKDRVVEKRDGEFPSTTTREHYHFTPDKAKEFYHKCVWGCKDRHGKKKPRS